MVAVSALCAGRGQGGVQTMWAVIGINVFKNFSVLTRHDESHSFVLMPKGR